MNFPDGGLFDLQVNGFAGVDFQRPLAAVDLARAARALHAHGTPRILLTLITDTVEALARQLAAIEALAAADPLVRATIAGYHLEGPYLLP